MKNLDVFSSKLQKAMEDLGKKNGFAPPASQDPADVVLHEFYIAKTGEAVFKRRASDALKRLLTGTVAEQAASVIQQTKKTDARVNASLVNGQHYVLTVETRKPTRTISTDQIAAELQKMGWNAEQVAALFSNCTKIQEPAQTFRSNPIRE